nr:MULTISPECIES: MarR family transcriptional regulator [unclassified Dyella]
MPLVAFCFNRWARANLPDGGGMTVPRSGLLFGLWNKREPVSMGELGEQYGMSPRSMTVLVDGLEKEGLLRRMPHEADRRVTLIEITPEGTQYVKTALGPAQLLTAAVFEDLPARERAEFLRLLSKVLDSLKARGIDVPPLE